MKWIAILAAGLLCLAASVNSDGPSASAQQKLVKEFMELNEWTEVGQARRREILGELESVPALTDNAIKSWKKRIVKTRKKAAMLEKKSGTHFLYPDAKDKQRRGKYVIGGDTKKPKGLLIAMHGGGVGSGDAEPMAAGYNGPAKKEDLVMIAPEVLEKTERGWTDSGTEQFVIELIQRGLATWDIDPNHVYLSGHSMGGYGSWAIGAHHADMCAGLAPSAGGPTPIMDMNGKEYDIVEGMVPNMRNLRLVIYQSDDDPRVPPGPNRIGAKKLGEAKERWGGFDFEYWEVTGYAHDPPPGGYGALLKKIVDAERTPWPTKVVWQPTLDWKQDFYWLHWEAPKRNAIVVAEVDRDKGEVTITCNKGQPTDMELWIDERILDVDKEIKVTLNGRPVFEGKPQASLVNLLMSAGRRDVEYLTPFRISLAQ